MLLLPLLQILDTAEERKKFEALYKKYKNYVMYISLKRLNVFHLAEENTQDVFFTLARNFRKIGAIDSPETKGYIYSVTNSCLINKFKKEFVRRLPEEMIADYADVPDEEFDLCEREDLKAAVDTLTEEEKTLLRLSVLCGFTSREIGERFGEKPAIVRKKMQNIRRKLRERMGESDE